MSQKVKKFISNIIWYFWEIKIATYRKKGWSCFLFRVYFTFVEVAIWKEFYSKIGESLSKCASAREARGELDARGLWRASFALSFQSVRGSDDVSFTLLCSLLLAASTVSAFRQKITKNAYIPELLNSWHSSSLDAIISKIVISK